MVEPGILNEGKVFSAWNSPTQQHIYFEYIFEI